MLQLQPRRIRTEKEPALGAVVIQAEQRTDPHPAIGADACLQVAIGGERRLDLMQAAALAVGKIGRLQAAGVVLVLGLALGMGGSLVGRGQYGLGHLAVGFEGGDDLLLKGALVHGRGL